MRFIKVLSAILALSSLLIVPASAFERGTKKEAIALVQKALSHIETVGLEQALQDFKKPTDNSFRDRDLYIFVYTY